VQSVMFSNRYQWASGGGRGVPPLGKYAQKGCIGHWKSARRRRASHRRSLSLGGFRPIAERMTMDECIVWFAVVMMGRQRR